MPTGENQRVRGTARDLKTVQAQCLRTIGGAYRATPTSQLQTELGIPPLNLYLDKRGADFERSRIENQKAHLLREGSVHVAKVIAGARTLQRTSRRGRTGIDPATKLRGGATQEKREWAEGWYGAGTASQALVAKWETQWRTHYGVEQTQAWGCGYGCGCGCERGARAVAVQVAAEELG